ncbi:MAG: WD40 repeat domain-containing serine/threonine protein kinase [Nannocystaceae bacterium]|nr:serine/threonine-protein kinase [bacterium]
MEQGPIDTEPTESALGGAARPSPDSAAFLSRLRENLRGKLFGSTVRPVPAEADGVAAGPHAPEAGQPGRIGRYQVLGRIGSGGMGVIYAALDPSLGRKVAVKLLNPKGGHREDARGRLLREAQALARLSHPSVVHVYEVGEYEDQVFVAMEFVQGMTLRKWQSSADHSWRAILATYKAAAEGLAAGHAAGIIHRDFKPDNVLVRFDGEVRVIDFGLARTEAEVSTRTEDTRMLPVDSDLALTKTGTLMGTPAYMAPEQFKGETADARTDQFSFCVALYEALYGYRPFSGTSIHHLAANVLRGNVESPPKYTDVPEKMMRVLLRGLEVDPIERFDDMDALLAELPAGRSRLWQVVGVLVVALGLAAVAVALGWAWLEDLRREERVASIKASYVAERGAEAESRLRHMQARDPAERYDELLLRGAEARIASDPVGAVAMLKALEPKTPSTLVPARLLAASAARAELQVRLVPVGAGPITALATSRDGATIVVGTRGYGAYRIDPDGPARPLRGSPDEVVSLDVTADGSRVVAGGSDGAVAMWTTPTGLATTWGRAGEGPTHVRISGDGSTIVSGDAAGRVQVGTPQGPKRTDKLHTAGISAVAVSSDGKTLATAGADGMVRMSFLEQRRRWDLPHRSGVSVSSLQFGLGELYVDCLGSDGLVWRLSTAERRSAIVEGVDSVGLYATAQGGQAQVSYGEGRPLRLVPSDGEPARELYQGKLSAVAMSGDGRVVVAADADDTVRVWRVVRPSDASHPLIDANVLTLAYDEAHDRLALGGTAGLVRLWTATGEERDAMGQLMGGVHELSFSPGGERLAALGGLGGITVWDLEGDRAPMALQPASFESPIGWSSDGTRLIAQNCEGPHRCGLVVHGLEDDQRLLSTVLGHRIERFALSEGSGFAVFVRGSKPAGVEVFDLSTGNAFRPPWPEGAEPSEVVGMAFVDNARALRLVSRDDEQIRLWYWEPASAIVTQLDTLESDAVHALPDGSAILMRTPEGSELWMVDEVLRYPVGTMPNVVERFVLSADRDVMLVESEGGVDVVHVPTGIRHAVNDIEPPYAWRGLSGFALGQPRAVVLRDDPTPSDPEAFADWLDTLTDVEPRALR